MVCLSVCLCVSVCLPFCLSLYLFLYMSAFLDHRMPFSVSFSLSTSASVSLIVYVPFTRAYSPALFVCSPVCLSIHTDRSYHNSGQIGCSGCLTLLLTASRPLRTCPLLSLITALSHLQPPITINNRIDKRRVGLCVWACVCRCVLDKSKHTVSTYSHT